MTLRWLHCDIMLTFFWPCCVNSAATPILPRSPVRKSIYHRPWVESLVSSVIRSTLIHDPASSPRIRPIRSGSGFRRPVTSTPGLWAHSFPGPLIIFWWVTWPRPRLEGCDGGIQVSRTQHRSPWKAPTLLLLPSSGELMVKNNAVRTFSDLLIFYIDDFVFCCFKNLKKKSHLHGFHISFGQGWNWWKTSTNRLHTLSTHIQIYLHACGQAHFFSVFMKIMYSSTPCLSQRHIDKHTHKHTQIGTH